MQRALRSCSSCTGRSQVALQSPAGSASPAAPPSARGPFSNSRPVISRPERVSSCEGTTKYSVLYVRGLHRLTVILSLRRIRDPSARRHELRILRLRSQARFAQDDIDLLEASPARVPALVYKGAGCRLWGGLNGTPRVRQIWRRCARRRYGDLADLRRAHRRRSA